METQQTPNQENINQQFNQQFGQQFGQQVLPNSTAVLVLGIISIVGCSCYGIVGLILGIIALVLAGNATRLYNANPEMYSLASYKNMKAGRICAIIGLSMAILAIIFVIICLILGFSMASNPWNMMH